MRIEAERLAPTLGVVSRTLARMCGIVSLALVELAQRQGLLAELAAGQFETDEERHFWVLDPPARRPRSGWAARAPLIDLTATQFEARYPGVPRFVYLAPDDAIRSSYVVETTGGRALREITSSDKEIAARLLNRTAAALEKVA